MHFRLIRSGDFAICASLVNPGFAVDARLRDAMPSLWRRLFVADQLQGGVVVDSESGESDSIVAFGLSAFIDEAFIDAYLRSPSPYVSAQVYERVLAGRSPVLGPKAVAAANSSSNLNLLILHFGLRYSSPGDDRGREAITLAQSGFRMCCVGYRIRRVLQEAYGPELPFFFAGGFLQKSDFGEYYAAQGDHEQSAEMRPYLMGLYGDDPESRYLGNSLSYLFQHAAPRFFFSAAEQRVLMHAVLGESDEAISDALGISFDAIKKTWKRIHARVESVAPSFYGEAVDATRGKERRRRLLRYVRDHLEELRPVVRSRRDR